MMIDVSDTAAAVAPAGVPPAAHGGTRLHGHALLLARLVWLVLVVASAIPTVLDIPGYFDRTGTYESDFGADLIRNSAGQVVFSNWLDGATTRAGVLDDDVLLVFDGIPVGPDTSIDDLQSARRVGVPLRLTVRTGNFPARQVTVYPANEDAGSLAPLRLTVRTMGIITLCSSLLGAFVWVGVGAFIAWRRSDDWLALLVSGGLITTYLSVSVANNLSPAQLGWAVLLSLWGALSVVLLVLIFYLFPNGRFTPRWTIAPAIASCLYTVVVYILPNTPIRLPVPLQGGGYAVVFVLGGIIQVVRYRRWFTPMERQQTKWVVLGAFIATWGIVLFEVNEVLSTGQAGVNQLTLDLLLWPAESLLVNFLPLSLLVAMLRYRLWDVDMVIRRTLIYGTLLGMLALVYGAAVLLLQVLSQAVTGPQSNVAIVAVTLVLVALFAPLRSRVQRAVDRRFYREKVNAHQALQGFAQEVRSLIELPELLQALVSRTTDLLHITHGAIFLAETGGAFHLAAARGFPDGATPALGPGPEALARLEHGTPLSQPQDATFPLLVPLAVPGDGSAHAAPALLGVLALGARRSAQAYARDDQALLASLADQAGTAIHVAQLVVARRAEETRREESEQQLAAYRASPMGRAETLANALVAQPTSALAEIHRLAQQAGYDPEAAALLGYLPQALAHLEARSLADLAQGVHYLVTGQGTPEVLPAGVKLIVTHLEGLAAAGWPGAPEGLSLYRLCRQALEAQTIPAIVELLPALRDPGWPAPGDAPQPERQTPIPAGRPGGALTLALRDLAAVTEALDAYERVETTDDQLAYLAAAIERLGRVRRDQGSADRAIVSHIIDGWLAVVTGAMRAVQTSARLTCTLLTRQSWQSEVVTLGVQVRNGGRAAALHLQVGCDPAPEYAVLDAPVVVPRLAPGEEMQVELRVQPHLPPGTARFRARFTIHYGDPREPQGVEVFADVVTLLPVAGPFRPIPNPYVVGTPLETGSPLFVGRVDLLAFIQEQLAGPQRNNLVLIGQRRTGKTSLLKQLPARLGEGFAAVYLDGQALGLDPGLPNFFLALATEIAYTLQDRGFAVETPELAQFLTAPAATFERVFLAQVRAMIGGRHLLLLLDEFEELEAAVRRGTLDDSIFPFLRHLIQHTPALSVIFCGTHRLEELAADYWHVLFNIALHRHVGFLARAEAERLIQEPVAAGMRYEDLALEKMWQVTAGHPYFLQLLCHGLVQRQNRQQRGYVTVADVNEALEELLAAGEAHFVYLWMEATAHGRLVLALLGHMLPLGGQITVAQVHAYLSERGAPLARGVVAQALQHLALRQVLVVADDTDAPAGARYRWKLGLLGLWVSAYRPFGRVREDLQ
jgi:hypothetical protein